MSFDETTYLTLAQRYKELSSGGGTTSGGDDIPFDIEGYLTEIDTGVIDANYMNSKFDKYLKLLNSGESSEEALSELHKTFATLSQEEQKYANIFLRDIQRGDATPSEDKTLRDYITEYMHRAKNDQIYRFSTVLGLDESKLRAMMEIRLTDANINGFGRLDELKKTVDKQKAKAFFEQAEQTTLNPAKVNIRIDAIIRKFILSGGFDLEG